jgi:hypothetical protein
MRGQGKVEVQHGGPGRSARRRANDLGNGSQHERKPPIEAAQIMNECDMCSEKLPGFNRDFAVVGGSSWCMQAERMGDQVGGQTRRSQFSVLGSN